MLRFLALAAIALSVLATSVFPQAAAPPKKAKISLLRELLSLPAPPPQDPLLKPKAPKERPPEFYDEDNPPSDDAPIEDLLDYWKYHNARYDEFRHNITPSDASMQRLIFECRSDPAKIVDYLNLFPKEGEFTTFIKQAFDQNLQEDKFEPRWTGAVGRWLQYNSPEAANQLINASQAVKDDPRRGYIQNHDELRALARLDWETAKTMVERLLNDPTQPNSQTMAKWIYYERAMATGDTSEADRYRTQLMAVVEDRNAPHGRRDLAMDALVLSGEWQGRDEWYLSLLEDETLLVMQDNNFTGLTTLISHTAQKDKKKWQERMLRLAESSNFAVRSAAARNLVKLYRPRNKEVLRALLPWLSNPEWAKQSADRERSQILGFLASEELPESADGLIWVLMNEDKDAGPRDPDDPYYENPNVMLAVAALQKNKIPSAAGPLRGLLLRIKGNENKLTVADALLACGGIPTKEQVLGLDAYATMLVNSEEFAERESYSNGIETDDEEETGDEEIKETGPEPGVAVIVRDTAVRAVRRVAIGSARISESPRAYYDGDGEEDEKPLPLPVIIGKLLTQKSEVEDATVLGLLDHLKRIRAAKPKVAEKLEEIMRKWESRVIDLQMLSQLQEGKATAETVVHLLSSRASLRKRVSQELTEMMGKGGALKGIAAAILEDNNDIFGTLEGSDAEAKTALLACARLIRAQLPSQAVSPYLEEADKELALAAERYLESEDSPEARGAILAANPGQAKLLGAMTAFRPGENYSVGENHLSLLFKSVNDTPFDLPPISFLRAHEKKLQAEVKENAKLTGIYALLENEEYGSKTVRIYEDKVVLTWYEDAARYREYTLDGDQFELLKRQIIDFKMDTLAPQLGPECYGCNQSEFIMLGKNGGRRVYFNAMAIESKPIASLLDLFNKLTESEDFKLTYKLSETMSGLEVLHANDKMQLKTLWKRDKDFRVLAEDKLKEAEGQREFQERLKERGKNAANRPYPIGNFPVSSAANRAANAVASAANSAIEKKDDKADPGEPDQGLIAMLNARFGHLSWRSFENGKLGGEAPQPEEVQFFRETTTPNGAKVRLPSREIPLGKGGYTVLPYFEDRAGIWLQSPDGKMSLIKEGWYEESEVSPDGKWVVAQMRNEDTGDSALVRINTQTKREFKVIPPPRTTLSVRFFVSLHNKMLVELYRDTPQPMPPRPTGAKAGEEPLNDGRLFALLDLNTGLLHGLRGNVAPLQQETFRTLQRTQAGTDFWAAIPKKGATEIGRYDLASFKFTPMMKIPAIGFDSMDMWIDEKEAKVYFVYQGHLLSLPLKKDTPPTPTRR